eukprot:TRINITY_DN3927_c0_g2_i2.p1 TRINITY_DN3927_c0_g2~~TRINITY_DN3927_c0_g2_i2.p1  ORF type:complete len:267 (-),score=32.70 TRINITY_DN3927_c0_g2_i2:137-937(-)
MQTIPLYQAQQKGIIPLCNAYLRSRGMRINDSLDSGILNDGVLLSHLIAAFAQKEVPHLQLPATMRIVQLGNLTTCLNFLKECGVKIIGIGAEDILSGNLKLILGLFWTLINQFHIRIGKQDGRSTVDLQSLIDILNTALPGSFPSECLTQDVTQMGNRLLTIAENILDIPHILDVEDIISGEVDPNLAACYLEFFKKKEQLVLANGLFLPIVRVSESPPLSDSDIIEDLKGGIEYVCHLPFRLANRALFTSVIMAGIRIFHLSFT